MEKELYTKSIIKGKEETDGRRVSVMSRHTHDDGITPDERIVEGISFDEWKKELAPPANLVGSYLRREIPWEEYEQKYLDYLRSDEMRTIVKEFAKRCTQEIITLMCIEETPENCHRRILAEELQRIQPDLKIVHN